MNFGIVILENARAIREDQIHWWNHLTHWRRLVPVCAVESRRWHFFLYTAIQGTFCLLLFNKLQYWGWNALRHFGRLRKQSHLYQKGLKSEEKLWCCGGGDEMKVGPWLGEWLNEESAATAQSQCVQKCKRASCVTGQPSGRFHAEGRCKAPCPTLQGYDTSEASNVRKCLYSIPIVGLIICYTAQQPPKICPPFTFGCGFIFVNCAWWIYSGQCHLGICPSDEWN